ncbi:MAG: class I SAM-dependent methyltransferase, partial [Chloroflexi bacterium]
MLYESYWARLLLDETFHPGGLELTRRLGELLGLRPGMRVLDVASGKGESALFLAQEFGCQVIGVDYSAQLVDEANDHAAAHGLADDVRFEHGDAEALPYPDASFDAVICECAFCVFTDKAQAAHEITRVLKPGG